ncbi:hypothetical protein BGX28_004090 [Mortierella sp. GBA30]|nr:hypothetical protein BGX28_004090 [Mortierella sp. GBA30]
MSKRNPKPTEEQEKKVKETETETETETDTPSPSAKPPTRPPPPAPELGLADLSDSSLQFLSVIEDNDENDDDQGDQESSNSDQRIAHRQDQQQNQQQKTISGFQAVTAIPKMMKFIDKIKHHTQNHQPEDVNRKEQQQTGVESHNKTATPKTISPALLAAAAQAEAEAEQRQKERERGPRIHPKLLELYEVTDRVLGVGTFATVKEIKLRSTGQSFALKIILKKTLQGKGAMLDTEIAVLSKVRHANCVSLLEMFETEDAVYLVTDLAAGGELFEQLLKKGYYTEGDAARLVREILLGVEYLHSMEVVHRDLKPENLLFHDKTENSRLMITDFGLSKVLTSGNDVLMTACGTPGYVAPEVLEEIGHGKPVDMWSVGVIAYTLLCGYTPFWGEDQPSLFENIISGEYQYEEDYWKDISPLAKSFIDSLLVTQAARRPTATQALSHPWFRAMLDQDLSAPASPADSVNLLPAMRKNFNARNVFKKAVRAVGILRRMQASSSPPSSSSPAGSGSDSEGDHHHTSGGGEVIPAPVMVVTEGQTAARVKNVGLSFHDVVSAAILTSQGGLRLDPVSGFVGMDTRTMDMVAVHNSEEHLDRVNAVLEDLTVKDVKEV